METWSVGQLLCYREEFVFMVRNIFVHFPMNSLSITIYFTTYINFMLMLTSYAILVLINFIRIGGAASQLSKCM